MTDDVRRVGGEFLVNTTVQGWQEQPVVTGLSDGSFVVSWMDSSGQGGDADGYSIKAQLYNAAGAPVGVEFLVNTSTAGFQYSPAISSLATGGFVVAWTDQNVVPGDPGYSEVKAQRYDAAGARVGPEFLVNTTTLSVQSTPAIAGLSGGGFVVSWMDFSGQGGDASDYSVKAQVYNSSGGRVGNEFLVNTATAGHQWYPKVSGLASGGFVVTWSDMSQVGGDTSSYGIKAQLYSSSGTRIGGEFLVNTSTQSDQQWPTMTALSNGGFVISWTDNSGQGGDSSSYSIKAQIYDATGARVGGEFLVNAATANAQEQPTIAALSNGDFVVAWRDYSEVGGDTSGAGIRAQVFDATGTRVGQEFLVNTKTFATQQQPTIAGLLNGSFVIGWTDHLGDGNAETGIKAQIFDLNTPPVASTVTLAALTEDTSRTITAAELLAGVTDVDGPAASITALSIASGGGTLVDDGGGTWTYTPAANFDGTVSFAYTATDGQYSASSTASLDITPVNDEPVASPVTLAPMAEDGTRIITAAQLLAGVVDIDGPAGTITALSNATGGGALTANGNQTWTYKPAANFNGLVSFNYTASDGEYQSSSTASLTVTPVDDPVGALPSSVTLDEDTTYTFASADFHVGDPDNGQSSPLQYITITSLPGAGTLRFNGVSLTSGDVASGFVVTVADLGAHKLTFLPAPNANSTGYATFNFAANSTGTNGLLAAWTFESGGADISGSGNNLTALGGASYGASDHSGGAADINGLLGSGLVSSSVDTDFGADDFGVELWVKFDSFAHETTLIEDFTGSGGPGWSLTMRAQNDLLFANGISGFQANSMAPVSLNAWHQFVVTRSGTQITLYVDGAHVGSASASGSIGGSGTPLLIGGRNSGDGRNFTLDGQVDDVSIWSRGLTAAEVARHWTTGANLGVGSASSTMTLNVTPIDDLPVAAADTVATQEDTPLTIDATVLIANDHDDDADHLSISSVGNAVNGTVAVDGDGNVLFAPTADFHGVASFTYVLTDGHTTSNEVTVTVNVSPVDDPPAAQPSSVALEEDTTYFFKVADFPVVDVDDGQAQDLRFITILDLPAKGALKFNGAVLTAQDVAHGYVVTAADLAAGKLTFVPDANDNEAEYADFSFSANSVGNDGLVAAWTFEGSGTDFSGHGHNVVLEGGAGYGTGLRGQGLELNGAQGSDAVAGPDLDSDFDSDEFSVEVWANFDSLNGEATLIEDFNMGGGPGWTLTLAEGFKLQFFVSQTFKVDYVPPPITLNTWHQFVVTRSGDSFTLYYDGQKVGDTLIVPDADIGAGPGNLLIGARNGSDQRNFTVDGTLDDISIWSRGLSAAEIATHWNDGNGVALVTSPSAPMSIDVTSVNDAPTTSAVTLAAIAEDGGVRLITQSQLLGKALDIDGPSLTATSLAISAGAGSLIDNGNGTWSYTTAPNDDTAVSFTYAVTDGSKTAAGTASLDITPVNDAPATSAVTLAAISEDSGARLITQAQLLANAADIDNAVLIATNLTIAAGRGALVDNHNGTWSFTPAANDDTSVSFTYTISDGSKTAVGTANLDVTPVNDAPVFDGSIAPSGTAGLLENATSVIALAGSDSDGDSLSFAIHSGVDSGLFSINAANGQLVFASAPDFEAKLDANRDGVYEVVVSLSDGHTTTLRTLAVTVGNVVGNDISATAKADKISLTRAVKGKSATNEEDRLDGMKGNDQLKGEGGNDTVIGGAGNDTLTGGTGIDTFLFNAKLAAANVDVITDFAHDVDVILLDDAIFKKLGDSLESKEFWAKAGATQAHDKNDRIIYNTKTGNIYYDDDGKGGHAAVLFATLSAKTALDAGDFAIA